MAAFSSVNAFLCFSSCPYIFGYIMFVEKPVKRTVKGIFKISIKSFFSFGFPKIINNGNNTEIVVRLKGMKKKNLVCLVAWPDANPIDKTNAKNNVELKDTVYLLLIEAVLFIDVEDCLFCSVFCL